MISDVMRFIETGRQNGNPASSPIGHGPTCGCHPCVAARPRWVSVMESNRAQWVVIDEDTYIEVQVRHDPQAIVRAYASGLHVHMTVDMPIPGNRRVWPFSKPSNLHVYLKLLNTHEPAVAYAYRMGDNVRIKSFHITEIGWPTQ